jgi:hypothetical protein
MAMAFHFADAPSTTGAPRTARPPTWPSLYRTFLQPRARRWAGCHLLDRAASPRALPRESALASFMFSPEFARFSQAIFGKRAGCRPEVGHGQRTVYRGLSRAPCRTRGASPVGLQRLSARPSCQGGTAVICRGGEHVPSLFRPEATSTRGAAARTRHVRGATFNNAFPAASAGGRGEACSNGIQSRLNRGTMDPPEQVSARVRGRPPEFNQRTASVANREPG